MFESSFRRWFSLALGLLLTGFGAFGQDRLLAPSEAMVLGIDYVLTPMAKDLRRRCTCVGAAFARSRLASCDIERSPPGTRRRTRRVPVPEKGRRAIYRHPEHAGPLAMASIALSASCSVVSGVMCSTSDRWPLSAHSS